MNFSTCFSMLSFISNLNYKIEEAGMGVICLVRSFLTFAKVPHAVLPTVTWWVNYEVSSDSQGNHYFRLLLLSILSVFNEYAL